MIARPELGQATVARSEARQSALASSSGVRAIRDPRGDSDAPPAVSTALKGHPAKSGTRFICCAMQPLSNRSAKITRGEIRSIVQIVSIRSIQKAGTMGIGDKIKNKAQEASGKAKEALGDATDNERLQAEGAKDQAAAKAKQAGEHVKDAAKDIKDDLS